jgi:decaprenylphospho-beta-D-ribofuranose 2-oxidase
MTVSPSDLPPWIKWEKVTAHAETHSTRSLVASPRSIDECREVIEFATKRGLSICPRGQGYSYGDIILNDDHVVLNLKGMDRILDWSPESGRIVAEPGATLGDLLFKAMPFNWTVNACPGGAGVTVGGAIANNIHGKDSWQTGNFGDSVVSVKLLIASGEILTIDRAEDRQLMEAVVAGMGLLGIIVEATLQLGKVPSPFIEVLFTPVKNTHGMIEHIEEARGKFDSFTGWADAFAKGPALGRGCVSSARWVDVPTVMSEERLAKSLEAPTKVFNLFPQDPTWFVLNKIFHPSLMGLANYFQYQAFRASHALFSSKTPQMLFTEYNFLFNRLPGWPKLFRPYGYIEFQPMIPRECGVEAIEKIFKMCQHHGFPSLMCGIKAHKKDDYIFSYSGDGYSIGIDIFFKARDRDRIRRLGRELFEYVLDCGGTTYLAKDLLVPRDLFERMYPRYIEFLEVKGRLDPSCLFRSDMYRRLLEPLPSP